MASTADYSADIMKYLSQLIMSKRARFVGTLATSLAVVYITVVLGGVAIVQGGGSPQEAVEWSYLNGRYGSGKVLVVSKNGSMWTRHVWVYTPDEENDFIMSPTFGRLRNCRDAPLFLFFGLSDSRPQMIDGEDFARRIVNQLTGKYDVASCSVLRCGDVLFSKMQFFSVTPEGVESYRTTKYYISWLLVSAISLLVWIVLAGTWLLLYDLFQMLRRLIITLHSPHGH